MAAVAVGGGAAADAAVSVIDADAVVAAIAAGEVETECEQETGFHQDSEEIGLEAVTVATSDYVVNQPIYKNLLGPAGIAEVMDLFVWKYQPLSYPEEQR